MLLYQNHCKKEKMLRNTLYFCTSQLCFFYVKLNVASTRRYTTALPRVWLIDWLVFVCPCRSLRLQMERLQCPGCHPGRNGLWLLSSLPGMCVRATSSIFLKMYSLFWELKLFRAFLLLCEFFTMMFSKWLRLVNLSSVIRMSSSQPLDLFFVFPFGKTRRQHSCRFPILSPHNCERGHGWVRGPSGPAA